jgi:hypothetical protein
MRKEAALLHWAAAYNMGDDNNDSGVPECLLGTAVNPVVN